MSVIEDSANKEDGSLEAVAHTLQYAKFMIFLNDGDAPAAEAALWRLLQLPLTPFSVALSAVKALNEESRQRVLLESAPFYKYLAGKYPT